MINRLTIHKSKQRRQHCSIVGVFVISHIPKALSTTESIDYTVPKLFPIVAWRHLKLCFEHQIKVSYG